MKPYLLMAALLLGACSGTPESDDPFLWLEEVEGADALNWVEAHNASSTAVLEAVPGFDAVQQRARSIYDSDARIPSPQLMGEYVYNFWQDADHERGIWRRMSIDAYRLKSTAWETVIDLDALGAAEDENWVWKGATCLYPDYDLCMLHLSRGGADATVDREFDMTSLAFVEDGFVVPEAKSGLAWYDRNTLWIGSDFGPGSMTESGYPMTVRVWNRGTALEEATTLFEGATDDVGSWPMIVDTPEAQYAGLVRAVTFYTSEAYLNYGGELARVPIPDDANIVGVFRGQMVVQLKSDWTLGDVTHPQGAVVSTDLEAFMDGGTDLDLIYAPDARSSVASVSSTRDRLLINRMRDVQSELFGYTFEDGKWIESEIPVPPLGTISMGSTDERADRFFFYYTGFTTPTSLYFVDGSTSSLLREDPAFFDADGLVVEQQAARSADGTQIPYFVVRDPSRSGPQPTLLYAYGGFEVSMRPGYDAVTGAAWLERGGVYVLANLRGGGEFGPAWHQAGLKENRQRIYDDFAAVAEDLIARGITTPRQLGISGGSNGGLLVGVAFTQRPELYNAVVCSVPLLDMKRFNQLLAGASWMGEYGDPDIPEEWEFISKYSPYQNVFDDRTYPEVFFNTSTRDDRVHPGHARKMVAKMEDQGHQILYFENTEGGHGGAVTNEQRAYRSALVFAYLYRQLFNTDVAG